jgi:hypothetical protein
VIALDNVVENDSYDHKTSPEDHRKNNGENAVIEIPKPSDAMQKHYLVRKEVGAVVLIKANSSPHAWLRIERGSGKTARIAGRCSLP